VRCDVGNVTHVVEHTQMCYTTVIAAVDVSVGGVIDCAPFLA